MSTYTQHTRHLGNDDNQDPNRSSMLTLSHQSLKFSDLKGACDPPRRVAVVWRLDRPVFVGIDVDNEA